MSATAHPLVALYSAPLCPAGSTMRVRFKLVADIAWQSTNLKSCGTATMNFYIGGMRATSTYQLRHDVIAGARITTGPTLTFTTGAVGDLTAGGDIHHAHALADQYHRRRHPVRRAHHGFALCPSSPSIAPAT